jgi:hypothetical protein
MANIKAPLKATLPDRGLLFIMVAVFSATFLSSHHPAAGWYWELSNGLGFAAFAGLLYLCLLVPKRHTLSYHQQISYTVVALVCIHALTLLIIEPQTLDYLIPPAPLPMWSGLLALVCLILLIGSTLQPLRSLAYHHHAAFKYWHRMLSWLVVAASGYHMIGSGFYLSNLWQGAVIALLAVVALWPGLPTPSVAIRAGSAFRLPLLAVAASLVFAALRNLTQ